MTSVLMFNILCVLTATSLFPVTSSLNLKTTNTTRKQIPRVLLISFDGFRAQYLNDHDMPNFKAFIDEGVFSKTKSSFPSLTFPNHYSLVTGMTVENHGITANTMYDKFMDRWFTPSCCDTDHTWWQQNPQVLPIWQANQRAGQNRRSGASGFVGSLSPICGMKLHKALEYSNSRPFEEIVDTMISWFTDPFDPVNFMSIYFYEPDKSGHEYGATATEMNSVLRACDDLLAYIKNLLSGKGLWDSTDIVITTDHGMMDVHPSRSSVLENYIDLSKLNVTNSLVVANIFTDNPQTTVDVYKNLTSIPNCAVYYRDTVPVEYKYSSNSRIGDVVVVADPGYMIYNTEEYKNTSTIRGTHGYNCSHPEMLGILAARGPSIQRPKQNEEDIVDVIDVYPFLEELLALPSRRKVDGSLKKLKKFLKRADIHAN